MIHTHFSECQKSSVAKSAPYQPMFQPPVLSPGSDMLEQEPEEVKLGCGTNRGSVRTHLPLGTVRHNAQGCRLTYRLWDTTRLEDRLGKGPKGFGIP